MSSKPCGAIVQLGKIRGLGPCDLGSNPSSPISNQNKMKTKKISHAGKFGVRYGKTIRERYNAVEDKQRKKQKCPFCSKLKVKRTAKGLWHCVSCNKKFTGGAYYLTE